MSQLPGFAGHRTRHALWFAFLVALLLGSVSPAWPQAKQGTYSGSYSAFGTYKATPIGKERLLVTWDENSMTLTNGLLDHMTWHCWATQDFVSGSGHAEGRRLGIDVAGDEIVANLGIVQHTPRPEDAPRIADTRCRHTFGTGKYAGISGSGALEFAADEFRTVTDGTYAVHASLEGNYKLP